MLYRALLVLITGLFVTMWTLLIRSEVQPNGNSLRTVPLDHVLHEIFLNEKPSQLMINDGTHRLGNLRINGRPESPDGSHTLEFFGNAQLNLPGGNLQRSAWNGELTVSHDWAIESFTLSAATREISKQAALPTQFELTLSPQTQTASYVVKAGGNVVDQQSFSTDEAGLNSLLDHFGIDETWRKQLRPSHGPKPVISAHQASLTIDKLKLETYLLSVVLNGQTLLEVHVSQLGEILQASTLFGWTLDVR